MTQPHLSIRGLSAGYGEISVLHDVDLDIAPGRVTAILGANGAGKTTLLSAIAGLVTKTAGSVTFAGEDVTRVPTSDMAARGLALVPEGGRLFPFMTVRENLELGAYRGDRRAISGRIDEVCAIFPILAQRRGQFAGRLSGGERQMCAVGRALMSRPRLLMLDEPSVGLSPIATENLLHNISALAASEGLTVVIVEQRVTEVLDIAHDVHILDHGRIARSGTATELRQDRHIQETYMGL